MDFLARQACWSQPDLEERLARQVYRVVVACTVGLYTHNRPITDSRRKPKLSDDKYKDGAHGLTRIAPKSVRIRL